MDSESDAPSDEDGSDAVVDDAGDDVISDDASDAVIDDAVVLPDGRTCTAHDEDRDGVPDDCDNCPNVANPDQAGGAIGDACAPSGSFITSPTRLLFDPFRTMTGWKVFGSAPALVLGSAADSFVGGSTSSSSLPFITGATGAGASAVVATTTMTVMEEAPTGGTAGLLARINGADTAKRAYLCAVSVRSGFALARLPDAGCGGGSCAPIAFTLPGSVPAQSPIPTDIPHGFGDTIGMRVSVTTSMGDGGIQGDIECRLFDPKRPETLLSTDPKYAIRVTAAGTRWFASGEVGVFAQQARAAFHSIDVLRGP